MTQPTIEQKLKDVLCILQKPELTYERNIVIEAIAALAEKQGVQAIRLQTIGDDLIVSVECKELGFVPVIKSYSGGVDIIIDHIVNPSGIEDAIKAALAAQREG